jgi:hypothetical protein
VHCLLASFWVLVVVAWVLLLPCWVCCCSHHVVELVACFWCSSASWFYFWWLGFGFRTLACSFAILVRLFAPTRWVLACFLACLVLVLCLLASSCCLSPGAPGCCLGAFGCFCYSYMASCWVCSSGSRFSGNHVRFLFLAFIPLA